jgi:hypothetical protein
VWQCFEDTATLNWTDEKGRATGGLSRPPIALARRSPPPRRYMPVEKLTGVCDNTNAATMIAAQ